MSHTLKGLVLGAALMTAGIVLTSCLGDYLEARAQVEQARQVSP